MSTSIWTFCHSIHFMSTLDFFLCLFRLLQFKSFLLISAVISIIYITQTPVSMSISQNFRKIISYLQCTCKIASKYIYINFNLLITIHIILIFSLSLWTIYSVSSQTFPQFRDLYNLFMYTSAQKFLFYQFLSTL